MKFKLNKVWQRVGRVPITSLDELEKLESQCSTLDVNDYVLKFQTLNWVDRDTHFIDVRDNVFYKGESIEDYD
jgi:hypothetical protein